MPSIISLLTALVPRNTQKRQSKLDDLVDEEKTILERQGVSRHSHARWSVDRRAGREMCITYSLWAARFFCFPQIAALLVDPLSCLPRRGGLDLRALFGRTEHGEYAALLC